MLLNGSQVELTRNNGTWTGSMDVPHGRSMNLVLTWLQGEIILGTYTLDVASVTEDLALEISPLMYRTYIYDDDGDGCSNLEELQANYDPQLASSPSDVSRVAMTSLTSLPRTVDFDRDGVPDAMDNCPVIMNADQSDIDGDAIGDWCDQLNENAQADTLSETDPASGFALTANLAPRVSEISSVPGGTTIRFTRTISETRTV